MIIYSTSIFYLWLFSMRDMLRERCERKPLGRKINMIGIGAAIYSITFPFSKLAAWFIHIFAIYVAYDNYGAGPAVLTFFLPFISEIYWFIFTVNTEGYYNGFALSIYLFLGLVVMNGLSIGLMAQGESSQSS